MDEGILNDLLECSVCLDRLDTSSKVLPCQHTFCRKCLEEIVHKHKELRCPECRILVNVRIDDLPPNVLLMRILEGMKNSGNHQNVAKPNTNAPTTNRSNTNRIVGVLQHQPGIGAADPHIRVNSNKHANAHHNVVAPHQPYAKAMYDYTAKESGDLNFKRGDIIILKRRIDGHWFQGECGGKLGIFPLSYVQIITPLPSHVPQCKALYDFRMTNDEEEGCLAFNKGDVINVIRRVDENWAEGKLDGKIGIFPLAFVEMNNLARSLMKLSSNAQPGPSRLAPPTPTAEDNSTTPLIPTDHSRTCIQQQPAAVAPVVSESNTTSSGSSSTPNVSSGNTTSSSGSSSVPSSPASPPPRSSKPLPPRAAAQHSAEIILNENLAIPERDKPRKAGHSSHNSGSASAEAHLPAAFIALYSYKPQKSDELELREGGIYIVTEICQDGWYKGTSNRTQKCGVFPGNCVTAARGNVAASSTSTKDSASTPSTESSAASKLPVSFTRTGCKSAPAATGRSGGTRSSNPPELPPRASSPSASSATPSSTNSGANVTTSSVHSDMATPLGRNSTASNNNNKMQELKYKDRKEKSTVSLMRRLASMERSKSPPASSYSMDNPVFEDVGTGTPTHPVHVRSLEGPSATSTPEIHRHKKSNSLDTGSKTKTGVQTVRERFRCIAPYPPNSEYELELQVSDIIYVHKKRDDGWYKGTQQRTGKTGLFPASFVESF